MFKFTFNLGSSAAANPFTAQAEQRDRIQQAVAPQTIKRKLPAPPRRPPPPPSVVEEAPRPKKREWVPTSSSASEPISQPTVTNGWIDTPAKYLAQASISRGDGDDQDADADFPPAKRRKTLTDSIISTAFSAALIGTAVGMTAYRLWRDRGKPSDEPVPPHVDAPPPYQKEEWADDQPRAQPAGRSPRLHKKPRPTARRVPRHRKTSIAVSPVQSPRVVSPLGLASAKHEDTIEDRGELEDQMDWMGDKLRQLIEEGQKALGKEVVIKTDEQNDEEEGAIDDGMEGWEEEDQGFSPAGPSSVTSSTRSRSRRPAKPLTIKTATSSSAAQGHTLSSPRHPPVSPYTRQSGFAAGSVYPETSPSFSSSFSSRHRLGARPSNEDEFEVIYEPGAFGTDFNPGEEPRLEDEDSLLLSQRMDAVRKAYNVH